MDWRNSDVGRFAIRHAGVIVTPKISGRRTVFETAADAADWAERNYKGPNWEIVELVKPVEQAGSKVR